jgi:hypothetical protein
MNPREKHDPMRKIGTNLYCVDGDWRGSTYRRRMTIIVSGGQVAIHSPIVLSEEGFAELDKLGKLAVIIAPNIHHGSEAQAYAERYPEAKVLVPYDAGGKLRKQVRIDGTLEDDWPEAFQRELVFRPVLGTRVHEAVFFHLPTQTLILTDLAYNLGDTARGWERLMLKALGILNRFGPSRLFERFLISEKAVFGESLEEIGRWDFDRIIVNHGAIIETDGKKKFQEAFARLRGRLPRRYRRETDPSRAQQG